VDPLQLAALRWAVDEQPAEKLPLLATDALVRGADSPALRELAGVRPGDFWEIKSLFEKTLDELGIEQVDAQTALWRLAQHMASEIENGGVRPIDGARWIWSNIYHRLDREGDLRVFVGLASEWDDYPLGRVEIEQAIVEKARRLVEQAEPRRWLRVQARRGQSPVVDSGLRIEISVVDLPVTENLARRVTEWAAQYETFGAGWEGFVTKGDAVDFVEEGKALVDLMQAELGPEWHVEYYPEATKPPGLRLRPTRSVP
jgi:hypothetical protein